ncbi:YheC/YheD family protein [Paenibacillus athensensis]|uniref:ATP-grasp domain-containing protein n=1 Tax=Paenibacillus athensensis TaxID=1967502 RepID=A0A4Y8PWE3_9BACL|nr:YheC/YheD family protein [Paenibacillus athensensis]MCD1260605.1 YheC/YheD family protein [Paenibacillus athensensis]
MSKRSVSKWGKYKVMREASALRPYLPKTAWNKPGTLRAMLHEYRDVIVKPTGGWGGQGVVRVRLRSAGAYEVHFGASRRTLHSETALISYLRKHAGSRAVVQQRIRLAAVNGRPFDCRVMVQRRPKGEWRVTGKLAKVAGKGYVVTNVRRSQGRIVSLAHAIRMSNIEGASSGALSSQMDHVALQTAQQLRKAYPSRRTIGLDMAFDRNGRVWIIEANFTPMLGLFRKLKDRSMYRTIMSY